MCSFFPESAISLAKNGAVMFFFDKLPGFFLQESELGLPEIREDFRGSWKRAGVHLRGIKSMQKHTRCALDALRKIWGKKHHHILIGFWHQRSHLWRYEAATFWEVVIFSPKKIPPLTVRSWCACFYTTISALQLNKGKFLEAIVQELQSFSVFSFVLDFMIFDRQHEVVSCFFWKSVGFLQNCFLDKWFWMRVFLRDSSKLEWFISVPMAGQKPSTLTSAWRLGFTKFHFVDDFISVSFCLLFFMFLHAFIETWLLFSSCFSNWLCLFRPQNFPKTSIISTSIIDHCQVAQGA